MTTTCPACGHESAISWRCERCGRDLADVDDDDDDGSAAPPLLADGSGVSRERGRDETRMERVTVRIPKTQLEDLEALVEQGIYPNRSEMIREAVRDLLDEHDASADALARDPDYMTDGGERVSHCGGRATHLRAERFEAAEVRRESRDAARERQARREVESQQREGQTVDQDPDDGRCPDCRDDVLPCLDCWLNGGGRDGE